MKLSTRLSRAAIRESWTLRYLTPPEPLDPTWIARAECRGIPADAVSTSLCATCTARLDCLHDAYLIEQDLALNEIFHVRGGLSAKVRVAALRSQRRPVEMHPLVSSIMAYEDETDAVA
jgi:hypothetical protein